MQPKVITHTHTLKNETPSPPGDHTHEIYTNMDIEWTHTYLLCVQSVPLPRDSNYIFKTLSKQMFSILAHMFVSDIVKHMSPMSPK